MWHASYRHFMRFFGWEYSGVCSIKADRGLREEDSINGFFETTVPSLIFKGLTHSVVMDINGIIVHDPNPQNNGFYLGKNKEEAGVIHWLMFEKTENAK